MVKVRRVGSDGTVPVRLHRFPCGCVVDRYETMLHTTEEYETVIECGWCGSTYDAGVLMEYLDDRPSPRMLAHRPLVTDGIRALEVVGFCGEGHPFVRNGPGREIEHVRQKLNALHN